MANQFSVQPLGGLDVGSKLNQVIEGGKQQYRIKQMQEKAPEVFNSGDPSRIANFMLEYPEMAKTMGNAIGVQDELQTKEAADVAKNMLMPGSDPREVLAQWAAKLKDYGRDPSRAVSMLTKVMQDPTQSEGMAQKLLAITAPDEFDAYRKAVGGAAVSPSQKTGAFLVKDPDGNVSIAVGSYNPSDGSLVTKTSVIPGGQLVTPLGETGGEKTSRAIVEAAGKKAAELGVELVQKPLVEGAVETAKSEAALAADIKLGGAAAASKILAEEAAKKSAAYSDQIEQIKGNILNLDEAISLIDQGAETGAIDKYLPDVKAASIKLKNLQGRLGLDIVSSITFGALSKSEMDMALGVALPIGLQPKELRKWLVAKKTAQVKLSKYLESAADYLGTPGNTVAGWKRLKRAEKKAGEGLPEGVTEDNVTEKMQTYGISREEVLKRYGVK